MNVNLNIIRNISLDNFIIDEEVIRESLIYRSHPEIKIDGVCNNESFDIYSIRDYIKEISFLDDSSEQIVEEESLEIEENGLIKFKYTILDALFFHYQENPNGTLVLDENGNSIRIDEQEIDEINFYFEGFLVQENDNEVFVVSKLTTNFTRFTNTLNNSKNLDCTI